MSRALQAGEFVESCTRWGISAMLVGYQRAGRTGRQLSDRNDSGRTAGVVGERPGRTGDRGRACD